MPIPSTGTFGVYLLSCKAGRDPWPATLWGVSVRFHDLYGAGGGGGGGPKIDHTSSILSNLGDVYIYIYISESIF